MSATARHAGLLIHELVGEIIGAGGEISRLAPQDLIERAAMAVKHKPFPQAERYGVVRVAGAVRVALDHLPQGWQFMGCEVAAGSGRVDLVWTEPGRWGRVLVDEMKLAGFVGIVDDPATHTQVLRYLTWGATEFAGRFAGVRVMALSAPRRSVMFYPNSPHSPERLTTTEFWWSRSRTEEIQ